jgi:hypothetical protein
MHRVTSKEATPKIEDDRVPSHCCLPKSICDAPIDFPHLFICRRIRDTMQLATIRPARRFGDFIMLPHSEVSTGGK